jgi:DNA-binding response OmpR family regulator
VNFQKQDIELMTTSPQGLRVLIVDDNQDGADTLGLVVEALGNQVHVTYSGAQALDVASAFRADLLLIDLVMPDIDGCRLGIQFRNTAGFARTKMVAVTGHKDPEHAALAMKAGFDTLLIKPVSLKELKAILSSVVVPMDRSSRPARARASHMESGRLSIEDARRIRSERTSKALTLAESEAAICEGVYRFQEEYMGRKSEKLHAHFVDDLLVIRVFGTMTQAEQQLGNSTSPEQGRDLIKQVRKQLLEMARPMLVSLVHEVAGVKAVSMHHDISTVTGEEVILFSLAKAPRFG